MATKFSLSIILVCIAYVLVRFMFPDTIEFGYDQPRLASTVLDFVRNGSYTTLQDYSLPSPWGNLSWGPALVLINSIFLISKNPITSSFLVILFNVLGVISVMFLAKDLFSKRTALIAGLFLTFHPWNIIFSRMVYQPAIITTLIAISMLLLFKSIDKPKSLYLGLLFFSWGVLLQSYLITFSFILVSAFVLIFKLRSKVISVKNILLGILLNLFIYIPTIMFYLKNNDLFLTFSSAPGKYKTLFVDVVKSFSEFISGSGFKWQLGYATDEFLNTIYGYDLFSKSILLLVTISLVYCLSEAFKKKSFILFSLVFFVLTPLVTIPLIGVEHVVPRYFLYTLPSLSILFGYFIDSIVSKFGRKVIIIPGIVFTFWTLFIFKYFSFVKHYDYPKGYLSHFSDVPYSFLEKSFEWIKEDSRNKGNDSLNISDDINFPKELRLNWAQRYFWENLMEDNYKQVSIKQGYYLMHFSPVPDNVKKYKQFGPYVVYEVGD